MKWLIALINLVLALLGLPIRPRSEDGARQPELRDKLRRKVHRTWGRHLVVPLALILLPGCATKTVYVRDGEPVRLRQTIRGAQVWVLDKSGQPVAGVMDLPEGWYCLPVPDDQE